MPKMSNEQWSNILIGVGLLILIVMFVGNQLFAVVGFNSPIGSITVEGISQKNAIGLFIGIVLLCIGIYMKKKK